MAESSPSAPRPRRRGVRRRPGRARRGFRTGALLPAVLLAALLAAQRSHGGPEGATDVAIDSGLRALHQGDFTRATAGFEQAVLSSPGAPVPLFFVVFSRWWQRVFGEAPASEADPAFDRGVESTLKAARERLESAPGDASALAALGGAQVLRSHLEAVRGNYFRSGQEARRGKKALDQALDSDGDLDIALFPAGALNYYADRVPLLVKGLRPLFFFPGGDAPLGLSQIRRVAEGRGPFRTDGRLLLAQICSDRYQRSYRESLAHFRLALQENPGSPLINAAIGDLQIRLGEYSDATATLTTAIEAATGDSPERWRQRQWLTLGLAEARLGEWKIDEAEEFIRRALQGPVPLSSSLSRTAKRLEEELSQKRAATPLLPKPGASRETSVVPAALAAEIRRTPGAPLPLYLRGKALLLEGRVEEALESLREAARSAGGAPPWLSGWIEIESGDAEERLGHLKEARAHYRRASGLRRFRAADRGRLKLEEKGEDAAACAAPAGS